MMTSTTFSNNIIRWTIQNTIPSSPTIATLSGWVGWYSYRVSLTYSQQINTWLIVRRMGVLGYLASPIVTPDISPWASTYFSIGMSCLTSFTLNHIARKFFNPLKKQKNEQEVIQQDSHTPKSPSKQITDSLPIAPKTIVTHNLTTEAQNQIVDTDLIQERKQENLLIQTATCALHP